MRHVYLDNAATTKPCRAAIDAALEMMEEHYANPDSIHSPGLEAGRGIENARAVTARAIGASPGEVYFTSGGTESNNLAIFGAFAAMRGKRHIVTTAAEHSSVLNAVKKLEADGCEATYIRADKDGVIDAVKVLDAVRPDTALVSVMLVNNETGCVAPVRSIAEGLKKARITALLHTDAVQGFLKLPVSVKALGADMLTLSGHKIYAPKGVGALYVKNGVKIRPMLYGGGQERGLRPGTPSTPFICAFGAAVSEGMEHFGVRTSTLETLKGYALERLTGNVGLLHIGAGEAPHIVSVCLPGYQSEVLVRFLSSRGVYVSGGSACARGRASHVLKSMGLPKTHIDGALRISLSHENTAEDIDILCETLKAAKEELIGGKL